jgi:hypothetical protein
LTTINIKQDDTQPAMKVRLKDSAGNPANLTGASVRVAIQHYSQPAIKFNRDAYIADAVAGEVWLIWQPGETQVTGLYRIEFRVTYQDGNRETFPNGGYLLVNILERIGD